MLKAVPFNSVALSDSFWQPRLEINRTVTIPFVWQQCIESGRLDNFAKAAGRMTGQHEASSQEGYFFFDSDVYKALEAAAYSLHSHPDPALASQVDEFIALIAAAQEADGYLYTARTIAPEALTAEREGLSRWSNLPVNHELYNVGHLYEAAVAHYRATGQRSLLDVALRNADLILSVFGENGRHDTPGHEEIEIGLVKLYEVTGEEKYWQLAQFFLDERGRHQRREVAHVPSRGRRRRSGFSGPLAASRSSLQSSWSSSSQLLELPRSTQLKQILSPVKPTVKPRKTLQATPFPTLPSHGSYAPCHSPVHWRFPTRPRTPPRGTSSNRPWRRMGEGCGPNCKGFSQVSSNPIRSNFPHP
jgi:hypothetical protein